MIISTILYVVGFFATIGAAMFCTEANLYTKDSQIIIPLLVAMSTLLIDLFWKTRERHLACKEIDALYDLTRHEKEALVSFHAILHKAHENQHFGSNLILANV